MAGDCEYQVLPAAGLGQGSMEYGVCVAAGMIAENRRLWVKVAGAWRQVARAYVKASGVWVPVAFWHKVDSSWIQMV
jgi:hypothetical protein